MWTIPLNQLNDSRSLASVTREMSAVSPKDCIMIIMKITRSENYSNQPCWFCTALFISPLLFTATPTCLLQYLGHLSVSSYHHGLSTCPTRVDGAIRSCLLLSRTARTSRVLSVPSGLNMCQLWSPLLVSTALHIHINSWLLNLEIGR